MARVLIVDDEEGIRTTVGAFAAKDGHTVSLAGDALEALALLGREPFDVVVTDIILPRRTGVALLADIRETQPDVQVIMLTGEPEVVTASEAVRKGAFDYLSKPVSREAITKVIAAAAEKKALLDKTHLLEEENRRHREQLEQLVDERTGQLRKLAARYETLFGSIADPVFVFDQETHHFLDCNQAALDRYGYAIGELRTMTPHDLHRPEERANAHENIIDVENISPNNYVHTTKDGKEFPVEVHTNQLDYDGVGAWISIVRDITKQAAAESKTRRLLKQQTAVNELALELGSVSDVSQIYEAVHKHVSSLMDAESLIISFYDEEEQLLRAGYALFQGEAFDVSELPPIPLEQKGHGTQSEVIHTGKPLYLADYRKTREKGTTEYNVDDDKTVRKGPPPGDADDITRSALLVPLALQGRVIGVMQVQSYRLDAYVKDDVDLLCGLANVAAVAIENSRLLQSIRDALAGTVSILGSVVEVRDLYTAGHQRRVTELACALGAELGLPEQTSNGLRVAGLLHDIGKISIPAEILSKPSRLTETELMLIRGHPQVAYDLLTHVRFPWPIAQIVLQHHERLDGSGYPQGLKGDAILLEAKLLAVADVVEAMSSHRPYRPALGIDAALEEIREHQGTLYDSDVVEACNQLFADGFQFAPAGGSPSP